MAAEGLPKDNCVKFRVEGNSISLSVRIYSFPLLCETIASFTRKM